MKHYALIGATSAIAQQCARQWVKRDAALLTLIGRNSVELEAVAKDIQIRSPESQINIQITDFESATDIQDTVRELFGKAIVDIALIAHGALPDQTRCQNDLLACKAALSINGVSPVLFMEAIAEQMERANHGTLAVIGSVAGDRGRKSNYIYGSAKGLIDRYAQGLQHRFAKIPVRIVLIKPGPTDTPMTAHLKTGGQRLAPVEKVAQDIISGIDRGCSVIYTPRIWHFVMWIIRHLPNLIFNKLPI